MDLGTVYMEKIVLANHENFLWLGSRPSYLKHYIFILRLYGNSKYAKQTDFFQLPGSEISACRDYSSWLENFVESFWIFAPKNVPPRTAEIVSLSRDYFLHINASWKESRPQTSLSYRRLFSLCRGPLMNKANYRDFRYVHKTHPSSPMSMFILYETQTWVTTETN